MFNVSFGKCFLLFVKKLFSILVWVFFIILNVRGREKDNSVR